MANTNDSGVDDSSKSTDKKHSSNKELLIVILIVISVCLLISCLTGTSIYFLKDQGNKSEIKVEVTPALEIDPTLSPTEVVEVNLEYDCDEDEPLNEGCLNEYAKEIDLNMNDFSSCVDKKIYDKSITESYEVGTALGVQGTPSTYFGKRGGDTFVGFYIPGPDYAILSELVEYAQDKSIGQVVNYRMEMLEANKAYYSEQLREYYAFDDTLTESEIEKIVQEYIDEYMNVELIEINLANSQLIGDGEVVIVEYSDYECPFCIDYAQNTIKKLHDDYADEGKLLFAHNDFPLDSIHPYARSAANAARCAGEQGKYFEYYDKLFRIN